MASPLQEPKHSVLAVLGESPGYVAAATDDLIKALDIRTGEILGGQATPIVYEEGGKEYLVIMAGGHHFMMTPAGDSLIAYALPDAK